MGGAAIRAGGKMGGAMRRQGLHLGPNGLRALRNWAAVTLMPTLGSRAKNEFLKIWVFVQRTEFSWNGESMITCQSLSIFSVSRIPQIRIMKFQCSHRQTIKLDILGRVLVSIKKK